MNARRNGADDPHPAGRDDRTGPDSLARTGALLGSLARTDAARPALLLVGGIDPTGQAGLARDIAACHAMDVTPCPVPTALTVQTSRDVEAVEGTRPALLQRMMEAALDEHDIQYAKIGAIVDPEQSMAIARVAAEHDLRLVVDPVLRSSSGSTFAAPDMLAPLWPHTALSTPNRDEAASLGALPCPMLVTGGGDRPDRLIEGGVAVASWPSTPQPGHHRGTGCRLATRIACGLATDLTLEAAIDLAHYELQQELALDAADQDLHGADQEVHGTDQDLRGAGEAVGTARTAHLRQTRRLVAAVLTELRFEHIPEVGINIAHAVLGATDPHRHVAGLAGRITIAGLGRAVAGRVAMGGPHHTGRIAVVLQEYDRDVRIVMNHRYDERFLHAARAGGLVDVGFRREDEPPDAPSSMEWGVRHCIDRNGGRVPDLVWDEGGPGKEPMIRVLARDREELVRKLRVLHGERERKRDAPGALLQRS